MMNLPLNVDFTGKVVVVTGAGGVLCGDMARAYAQAGAKVAETCFFSSVKNSSNAENCFMAATFFSFESNLGAFCIIVGKSTSLQHNCPIASCSVNSTAPCILAPPSVALYTVIFPCARLIASSNHLR